MTIVVAPGEPWLTRAVTPPMLTRTIPMGSR
jgi:hypothetical protein